MKNKNEVNNLVEYCEGLLRAYECYTKQNTETIFDNGDYECLKDLIEKIKKGEA